LAQGDVDAAAGSIREALESPPRIPSGEQPPGTDWKRAPLLAAQVEIAIAAGDPSRARWAADELGEIAGRLGTKALRASAAVSKGSVQLADGDVAAARSSLQEGISLWGELRAPYEVARARMAMAEAYRAAGNREHVLLELRAARSTFERIGAELDARHAAEALEREGVESAATEQKVFMFTDIVSSTALVEAIGDDAWTDVIRWHDQTLRSLFVSHDGVEIDHAGDGFFVTFDDAGVAVRCAIAIQRRLAEHRKDHGFSPQVRIGLHAAKARRSGKSFRGKAVHQAARIAAIAEGGEIVASRTTLRAAGRETPDADIRAVSLKGISEPVEVAPVSWR
jgi:class 3 adenylate cyclase